MTIEQIFKLALQMGIEADPRGKKGIKQYLETVEKKYKQMKPQEKKYFDKDKLINPFSDSKIHVQTDKNKPVKTVMVGIDIGDGEILLASQLGERKKQIDLVISHHPIGAGLADLHTVMDMQVEVFVRAGVPVHVAEKIMEERMKEVGRGVHPINHYKIINLAELLRVNLINTHTITDNLVTEYLNNLFVKRKPCLVGDILDLLLEIPEYQEAKKRGAGPSLFTGSKEHRVGFHLVEMTGGTSPSDEVYKELSRYGISTVVGMHMKDTARKKASKHHMNVIIAGHMASDSLGMNLFLDQLENKGIEVVPCGGLIRVSRSKK